MKKRILSVFFELVKNSKMSDRDIAKKLDISQPTVTRIRKKLERSNIKKYTVLPGLTEMGIHIISFNLGDCHNSKKDKDVCFKEIAKNEPRIAFIASGEGMRKTCLIIGLHKDYKDYVKFLSNIRSQCGGSEKNFESFLVPTTKELNLDFANPLLTILKNSDNTT